MKLAFQENVDLASLTTLGVGGKARYFFEVRNEDEAREAIGFARERKAPVFVLGGGSNVLAEDAGFQGAVIHINIKGISSEQKENHTILRAGAGEEWDRVVSYSVANELAGIECLSGIPGSTGGALVQNAGAYGQDLSEVVYEARAIDTKTGKIKIFRAEECGFEYRSSKFKKENGRYLITEIALALIPHGASPLLHHELKNYFAGKPLPTLREVRDAVIEIRANKGSVIMPGYKCYKTAGSFFKNPIVGRGKFAQIEKIIAETSSLGGCENPWFWKLEDDRVKISAACLIGRVGFGKGYRDGAVGISPKHSLSIVNFGGAKAEEIIALSNKIKERVRNAFGVELEEEVVRIR